MTKIPTQNAICKKYKQSIEAAHLFDVLSILSVEFQMLLDRNILGIGVSDNTYKSFFELKDMFGHKPINAYQVGTNSFTGYGVTVHNVSDSQTTDDTIYVMSEPKKIPTKGFIKKTITHYNYKEIIKQVSLG